MHPCSFFHQNKVESSFCCLRKLRSAKSWTLSYACGYLSVCQSFSGFRAWLNVNFFPVVFPFWCFFLILHWLTGKKQICDDRHTKKARQIHTDAHWQACRREMETKQYSIKIWKYLNSTKSRDTERNITIVAEIKQAAIFKKPPPLRITLNKPTKTLL